MLGYKEFMYNENVHTSVLTSILIIRSGFALCLQHIVMK